MTTGATGARECEICRLQDGRACWAWHKFCRAELNPIALIQFIEGQKLGVAGDVIVGYVSAVTGMDIKAFREWEQRERVTALREAQP
jgi:hypothetical protein